MGKFNYNLSVVQNMQIAPFMNSTSAMDMIYNKFQMFMLQASAQISATNINNGSIFNSQAPNGAGTTPPAFNMPTMQMNSVNPAGNAGGVNTPAADSNTTLTGHHDLNYWKSQGYDENMGRRLAQDAVSTCRGRADGGCVGYTRRTINRLYGTNFTNAGAAENFGTKILNSPQLRGKFKKFQINGISGNEVPDGAILIWPHTAYRPGTAAGRYGHGGIASGGKVYSDCVCRDLSKCCEIWIPVSA